MRIVINNSLYDIVSRISRYYVPLVGVLYVLASIFLSNSPSALVLSCIILADAILGLLLLAVRSKWKAKDTLVIDDRDPENMTFGFESGRRLEELKHDKVLVLKVRKLGSEVRDTFGAYSDHHKGRSSL